MVVLHRNYIKYFIVLNYYKMIPKNIYMCNKTKENTEKYTNQWKTLNPEYEVFIYDDNDCKDFLLNNFGQLYVDIFNFLRDGPIKADFWRICVLYVNGGVYTDIDNVPLVPIDKFLEDGVDLLTCSSYMRNPRFLTLFNPNLIIVSQNNPIIKQCIDWYVDKYNNDKGYEYYKWSIMVAFTDVLRIPKYNREEGIFYYNSHKIQILNEVPGQHHYDAHNLYKGKRIFNNRCQDWDADAHSFR